MDSAIDLLDASQALDLSNIRFQLMWVEHEHLTQPIMLNEGLVDLRTLSHST